MTALEGLRVVDFSRFLPGAYASWVAADMGADVVRIEHPRELAKQAAMFGKGADMEAERRRRARPSYVRNKRSLLINPGHAHAHRVLHPLIARADVLIEDYRPGIMAGMGLGYAAMAAINPGLVYCSVSFAGQTGPLADRAGHDPAALALAGTLSRLNGLPTPTLPSLQVADVLTGAHTTIAMLLALQAKSRTGRGQHVDVAMSDASMSLLLVNLGRTDDADALPELGKWHPKGGVWVCADGGYLCTTDMEPRYWARFCEAIGRPDLGPRQQDTPHHPDMQREIAAVIATRPRDEWVALLATADTQAQPVLSMAEAIAHPHHRARGMVVDVTLPGAEPLTQLALPFHLLDTPAVAPVAAGDPGADTDAILAELGLSGDAEALRAAGLFDDAKGATA
ncbi:CaiB/BaiF CoA-transferase family protein [Sphingomonas sp. BIUV-7]|uniref:CaiB/BaiF CoA-transferase family protein n=1 Tax=Sphingomonas natans TaxID=3063330 RepID=A0ABT8YA90_9SPHN|nr:CaiB/BaiF CoA-transferase family protein [Sphingomonas sp. BIUV-7]MDO6415239.1 CaiB/BaiF CoA-transferase family protein [Sphingomonas sp. BIUV-7]